MNNRDNLIDNIRHSSREMVRELGLLSGEIFNHLPHSFCHTLLEINLHGALNHIELANLLKLDKSTISRIVKKLLQEKLVVLEQNSGDQRYKHLLLTAEGKKVVENINKSSNKQVNDALLQLSETEQDNVRLGIELYAKGLKRARLHGAYQIRPLQKKDNIEMVRIIKSVLKEYSADYQRYAATDPELENMYKYYSSDKSIYFVVERKKDNKLIGGGGFAQFNGSDKPICEFKKMYFVPEARGLGLGYALLQKVLSVAKENGYKECCLETLNSMERANNLYRKTGFSKLAKPLAKSCHPECNTWYSKKLST